MKTGTNRPWRKYDAAPVRAQNGRRGSWLRLSLALAALSLAIAATAAPAAAMTGGAGVASTDGSVPAGRNLVFGPTRSAGATWYGPGLYGNGTACGQTLRPRTVGVAHRTLPCGTAIRFAYHGHYLLTRVIDRGPYTPGNDFDLTNGARRALGFEGVGTVRYSIGRRPGARQSARRRSGHRS